MTPFMIFLRRSTARRAFVLLVAAGLFAVFSRETWRGEWARTFDWAMGAVILVGPVAAGIAAYDAYTTLGRAWRQISATMPRAGAEAALSACAVWLWSCVAWLCVAIVAMTATVSSASGPPAVQYWALVAVVGILLAASAVGTAIGLLIPHLVAGPLAVIVVFCIPIACAWLDLPHIFVFGGATGTLVGLRYSVGVVAMLLLLNLCVAVLAIAIASWALRRNAAGRCTWALLAAPVAVFVVAVLLGPSTGNAFVPDVHVAYDCTGQAPQICMARATSAHLAEVDAEARPLISALAALGASLPSRYEQRFAAPDPTVGSIELSDDELTAGKVSKDDVALSIARPADCAAYYGPVPPDDALNAQALIADWALRKSGTGNARGWVGARADDAVISGKLDGWVRRTFDQLSKCEFDDIAKPSL
ncbi:hypothetical protein [Cellulomonas alba]|uniref:ABC transporter permease n=1 Tax=Cellulomonas alba TaxID=3053467 RepID=A0ABT7SJ86_9CELL|nr:hypothetical protein [Cellulomonas alba]MDM7856243.1 hypothetical protein [Cellulomonas alba]